MSEQLLGHQKKGLIFVLSAPAGTGKSTLVDMLMQEFPQVRASRSCTTRPPRLGEIVGQHYRFLTIAEFEIGIARSDFLEYAQVFGNYYGTLHHEVTQLQEQGQHLILVIDTQGAKQILNRVPAVSIFVSPPSLQELERRLYKRSTESPENIAERLRWAQQEIDQHVHYDYHIVNDHLSITYQILRSIVIAETHKNLKERSCL